ncbi:MAG: short-chain dehydrogenase/reductase family protein [Bacteriovoracaceae bacterium]|nr:short-chain dehydrogenase/reductase family protein [Bacteriovoracaceae bacterium]
MGKFENKKVLITGGNSGMGFESARHFIREGAKVAITGRNLDGLKRAESELGPNLIAIQADISDLRGHAALANELRERLGQIDVLFLNAGVGTFAPFEQSTTENFDQTFAINVRGPFFLTQSLLPLLKEGSSILFNASIAAHLGMPTASVYSGSKGALKSIARVLAEELAVKKIRVNILSPGPIDTPIFNRAGLDPKETENFKKQMAESTPLKRLGTVQEIAALVAFISSPDAGFITGSEFVIDGGMSKL